MERVEQKLSSIDTDKTGKIVASTFKKIMAAETTLGPVHIHYLILAAGTCPLPLLCDSRSVPAPLYVCKPVSSSANARIFFFAY